MFNLLRTRAVTVETQPYHVVAQGGEEDGVAQKVRLVQQSGQDVARQLHLDATWPQQTTNNQHAEF